MNADWVNHNLDCLAKNLETRLPLSQTREFDPPQELSGYVALADDPNSFVQQLCTHIGISFIPVAQVVGDSNIPRLDLRSGARFFDKEIDSAGDYSAKAIHGSKIRIGASHFRRPYMLGHILAHEVAHHFMHFNLIRSASEDDNEMFTDLTAVYLGFGKLMLNGGEDTSASSINDPITVSKEGNVYLGYPLLAYSYYLCQTKRGISEPALYEHLVGPCVSIVKAFAYHRGCVYRSRTDDDIALDNTRKSWWKRFLQLFNPPPAVPLVPELPQTNGTRVYEDAWRTDSRRFRLVDCPGCATRIKIPKTEKKLQVTCPKCRREFLVGIRYK